MDSAVAWDLHNEPSLTEVLEYKGVGGGGISLKLKRLFAQQNQQTIDAILSLLILNNNFKIKQKLQLPKKQLQLKCLSALLHSKSEQRQRLAFW